MQPTIPPHFSQFTSYNFIQQYINISIDEQPLCLFLSELFHDLFRRSATEHNKNIAITKLTFIEALGLPLIISERLFFAFTNTRHAKCITKNEFIKGFSDLYTNDMDKKLKIVSKMFDFDLNGMLRVDDITLLFIHFYYFSLGTANCFESFKEIEQIIHKALTPKKKITLRSFENIINNYNADTFYLFLFFLNQHRPFTCEQVKYFLECNHIATPNTFFPSTNSFTVDKDNGFVYTPCSSNNINKFRCSIDDVQTNQHAHTIRTKLDIEPTQELIGLLCKQSCNNNKLSNGDETKHTTNNNNNNTHDSDHNADDELSDLNDLEMFEEDLLSALSKIEYCFVPKCNTNKLIKKQSKSFSILTSEDMRKRDMFSLHPEMSLDKPQKTPNNNNANESNLSIKNVRTFNELQNKSFNNTNNSNIASISVIASKSNSRMEIPVNRKIDLNFTSSPKKKHYMHSKTINLNEPRTPQTQKSKVINFTSSIIAANNTSSPLHKYKQFTKNSTKYSGSITPKRSSKEELNIDYHNTNNYFEIHVNYYTRSGAIRDCILLVIDDVIFVHIFNGFCYKYLKMINLKFTLIEEIEIWETLSNSVLRRIKLSSFLNKTYKEMIFSSPDQKQMDLFIAKVKLISKYQNDINLKYKSIKEIYRGTKSKLFLGENIQTKEKVAIKYINLSLCSKQESYETMLWEFDLMQLLHKTNHHKNIVKVYDLYKTTEHFIFVLEYIPHGNLKSYLIENRYTLSKADHKRIIQQLANAVLFLHSNGIIHRDLKPENILVKVKDKNKMKIKLIDLGFGKVIGKGELLTEPYGTFCYASPEVLKKVPYTFETDIWSLGVIFYLIVVGVHPFGENDKDLKTIHKNICDVVYSFPNDSDVNCYVKDVIDLCLRKEPKQRPKINDVVKLLKKYQI